MSFFKSGGRSIAALLDYSLINYGPIYLEAINNSHMFHELYFSQMIYFAGGSICNR